MINYTIGRDIIVNLFRDANVQSALNEIDTFKMFDAFYQNDYELICEYLRTELEPLYSKATLDKLPLRHKDLIRKVLRLKTAGIYDDEPQRSIILKEGEEGKSPVIDENFSLMLENAKYNMQLKEAAMQSLFFNTILVQPVWRNERIEIDIYNHAVCDVKVDPNDYLKPIEVYLAFADVETNELYIAVWTENDHYLLDANGTEIREWKGTKLKNNYNILPFSVLRIRQGKDFWGEPNWNLLNTQKSFDISLTNFKQIELFQSFGVWLAVNMKLKENETLSPNTIKTVDDVRSDMQPPSLTNTVPAVDFAALRDNLDWDWKTTMSSEGMAGNTSDTETRLQSGVSKGYDELETQIQREDLKNILYYFEMDLLAKCITVYNAESQGDKIKEGDIEIVFSEEKPAETISDKKTRREMEKAYGIKNEIDFAMEDLEINREEAIKVVAKNLGLGEIKDEKAVIDALNSKAKTTGNSILDKYMQRNQLNENNPQLNK
jgi:hypothetical protein